MLYAGLHPQMNLQAPIRVSIVEDNAKLRESLAVLIGGAAGFQCVSTHESAEQSLKQLPAKKPDVVLMDINLPQMSGTDCVPLLKQAIPGVRVIMLTVYDDEEQLFNSLRAGADGYLLKRTPPARILEAIAEVLSGNAPMSGQIARMVVEYFHQRMAPREDEKLTPREKEILAQLAKGFHNKEIAAALAMSVDTVRAHLRNIYEKLHVASRAEAIVRFLGQQR